MNFDVFSSLTTDDLRILAQAAKPRGFTAWRDSIPSVSYLHALGLISRKTDRSVWRITPFGKAALEAVADRVRTATSHKSK
jgi:hypothetical protein